MKGAVIAICISMGIVLPVLFLSPLQISRKDAKEVSGIVTTIYEAGSRDVVFKLAGIRFSFYINRGLEHNLNLSELQNNILGKEVTILFADNWTPFDPGANKHIAEMSLGNKLLYSELK